MPISGTRAPPRPRGWTWERRQVEACPLRRTMEPCVGGGAEPMRLVTTIPTPPAATSGLSGGTRGTARDRQARWEVRGTPHQPSPSQSARRPLGAGSHPRLPEPVPAHPCRARQSRARLTIRVPDRVAQPLHQGTELREGLRPTSVCPLTPDGTRLQGRRLLGRLRVESDRDVVGTSGHHQTHAVVLAPRLNPGNRGQQADDVMSPKRRESRTGRASRKG